MAPDEICHTVLDESESGRPVAAQDDEFQHPVNLGDLSKFKCADCHSGKNWTLEGD